MLGFFLVNFVLVLLVVVVKIFVLMFFVFVVFCIFEINNDVDILVVYINIIVFLVIINMFLDCFKFICYSGCFNKLFLL